MKLLMFTGEWCGPCKQLKPIVNELVNEYGLDFEEVDVDRRGELAVKYRVQSIPCLVFLKDGEVVDMLHGVKPKHFIRQIIERVKHA
jgi:thioredoxin 1